MFITYGMIFTALAIVGVAYLSLATLPLWSTLLHAIGRWWSKQNRKRDDEPSTF